MLQKKRLMVVAAGLFTGAAMGAGFQLYTEGSAEALGQAGAISGRTNLTSLAWYNPSALAGADRPAVMIGSALVSIHTEYKSGVGADAEMSDEWRLIPHFYYVQPLTAQFTATLSVNAPYGLITEWPDEWGPDLGFGAIGSLLATYSELRSIYITPSIGWRINDMVSLGAGVSVVDAEAKLEGTGRVVEGDGLSYGGAVSAHIQPLEDWGFGVRYQSRVDLNLTGTLNDSIATSADLTLPSTVNFGLANSSINNLSLGLDLVWTEWSTYDVLAVENLPKSEKNWEDVISIRFGGEYALGDSWLLRAGYIWDESPVPDDTRAPEMPGSDRHMITAGVGWKFWKTMTLDAAYSYLWAEEAPAGTDLPIPLPGEFETTTHLLAFSLGYTF